MSLSARIMNLPTKNAREELLRHAAAELAAEADATIAALRGENGVLRGLLRAADNTLDTIDEDSDASAEGLAALRQSIDAALKRTLPQTGMAEADAIRDELVAALEVAQEALRWMSDCYVGEDDEAGECASCHERSYKPHAPDCKKTQAIAAINAALAHVKGQA